MIIFKDLCFDEHGMLSYAIHNGKRFFTNSPLWKINCNNNEYTIKDMESFTYSEYDNYIELKWSSSEVNIIVSVFYEDKYEFNIAVKSLNSEIENVVFPIFDDVNSISQDCQKKMAIKKKAIA